MDSGESLAPVTLAYQTYGMLNADKTNAILIYHALTGDQFAAEPHPITGKPGWWESLIGPSKPMDPEQYFLICVNVVGGCMGSSGPADINPSTGQAYGLSFPVVTIGDMVRGAMRVVDAFLSIPGVLSLLVLVAIFGTGNAVMISTLAFFFGIPVIRVIRAATHDVVARDFVLAARARGHSRLSIVWRELLPNVRDAMMVEGAMRWSWMLLAFSSLSFLGFGVSPPTPDWAAMIDEERAYMPLAPWGVLGPVVALSSLIIGINLTADALAKAMGIDRARKAVV